MPTANLLAQSLTTTLYEAEFFTRRLNPIGAAHAFVSRDNIQKKLDSYDGTEPSPMQWALRGMAMARHGCMPLTLICDMAVGTGRTRFVVGERPEPDKEDSVLGYELKVLKAELYNLTHFNHEQRVKWLLHRVEQTMQHPCDLGLAGVVVGASNLPALFASSAVSSVIFAIVGCAAYLVQRAAGDRQTFFIETINKTPSWFNGPAAVLVKNFTQSIPLTFNLMTHLINLSFHVSATIPMHLTLQSARLATLCIKVAICLVGAMVGLTVGAGMQTTHALQRFVERRAKPKAMGISSNLAKLLQQT